MKKHFSASLFVAVTLGLAWALRGHFGHEWGASWAGAAGVLALLLVSGRRDWARRAPVVAALGAVGWGAGGMMSYGMIVGYCRSLSFPDALYGYAMLSVVGGLYGFAGGGLPALALETDEKKRPDWARLMAEMVAGALLAWGLLIYQMEWFMTPPRSELWAAMLGASAALAWYLARNGYRRALRVAAYSALGAAFGFSFGNFLQTLGTASGIPYNWWNVMEFTLGFFGGLGMAWAVLTRDWPESPAPTRTGHLLATVFVFLFIPFANFANSMSAEKFLDRARQFHLEVNPLFGCRQMWVAAALLVLFAAVFFSLWLRRSVDRSKALAATPFLVLLEYNLFAWLVLLTFVRPFRLSRSEALYPFVLLLLGAWWWWGLRRTPAQPADDGRRESGLRWTLLLLLWAAAMAALALISVNSHGPLPGAQERFTL